MKLKRIIPLLASSLLLASCSNSPFKPATSSSTSHSSTSSSTTSHTSTSSHSSGSGSSSSSSTIPFVPTIDDKSWTIMIYMCGSNLESGWDSEYEEYGDSYLASLDLEEILSVTGQPSDVNIIVETGGSKRWLSKGEGGFGISNSKLSRYHVKDRSLVLDTTLTNACMGEQSTLESFLNWGLTNYPAEKTGVIFWDHGGGMFGVCNDELYDNECLTNDEVQGAFESVFTSKGISKLEFVGYDACLMAIQDVAESNSKYFNYMVCSQESESGEGWDYDTWVDKLYLKYSTKDICRCIVDGFIESMGGVNAKGYTYMGVYYPADQTLSYLDLSYMSAYKTAWENMAAALKTKVGSSYSSFRSSVIAKTKYFAGEDYYYFSEYDVIHFLDQLDVSSFKLSGTYTSDVRSAFNNLVAYNVSQKEAAKDAHGLSLFFPSGNGYISSQKAVYTTSHTNLSNWRSFVTSAGGNVSSTYNYKK